MVCPHLMVTQMMQSQKASGDYMRGEIEEYFEVGRIKFVSVGTSTDRNKCQYKKGDLPIGWVILTYQAVDKKNGFKAEQKTLAILAEGRNVKEDFLKLLTTWNNQNGDYFYGPA